MATWMKTKFPGVRYREHPTRKHGVGKDRYFVIRFMVDGIRKEEPCGWASEEMTAEEAYKRLAAVKNNIKQGTGPRSLAETRQANQTRREEEERLRRQKEKAAVTVREFWEKEYQPWAASTKTHRTLLTEKGRFLNWIAPLIGDIPLQQIDVSHIEGLKRRAAKAGKSPTTIRHIIMDVSGIWNAAKDRGVVQGDNPAHRTAKPRLDNKRERFLNHKEARILLEALARKSPDTHDEALLSLFAGLRAGETHNLIWADVDWENGLLSLRDTKSGRNRHAYFTKEIREMLERRYTGQPKNALIFPAKTGGKRNEVSNTFQRIVDELGLNDSGEYKPDAAGNRIPVKIADERQRIVFHSLRHTFASWLVKNGTPLYEVAKLLGHSTIQMTQRYAHLAPDNLRRAVAGLEGALEEKSATVLPFAGKAST